jgi:hypothetical protein
VLLGRVVICGPGEGVSAARTSGGTTAVVLFAGRVKASALLGRVMERLR